MQKESVQKTSRIFKEINMALFDGNSIIVNKGGTRSGKTWSTLQLILALANTVGGVVFSIVGETLPFLKRGAMRDFKTMLGDGWEEDAWNATDKIYNMPTGSVVEFFSADNEGKVHGSSRDFLFINECYFVDWEIYRQLAVRTRRAVLLDYNPRSRFWVDEWLIGKPNVALIQSTYKDNPFLTERQVKEIESYKDTDPNWWRVYGEGETGSVEGLVYANWATVREMPRECKREFWCIDFGFVNDPTAILHVKLSGGELWIDEIAYRTGMLNKDITDELHGAGVPLNAPIVCDSAEQKSIAEINSVGGYHAVPVSKGRGSVVGGITAVQAYRLNVTQRSLGVIEELRNYSWRRDVNGNYINEPVDRFNHALDALRYGVTTFLASRRPLAVPRAHLGHIC